MKNKGFFFSLSFILLTAFIISWSGTFLPSSVLSQQPKKPSIPASVQELQDTFVAIGENARKAVVGISVTSVIRPQLFSQNPRQDELFRFFFGIPDQEFRQSGIGSGFIVSPEGYIITNEHVIQNADEITVFLPDGRRMEAKLTGYDIRSDLAVLKINSDEPFPYLELGDSDQVKPGQWAIAVGNPFAIYKNNPQPTMTLGIIGAVHRNLPTSEPNDRYYGDLIQTDAAINPGNSGGPLLNVYGQVIGINVAILSSTGQNSGVGFALPSKQAKRILNSLISGETVQYGWLGIAIQDLTPELCEKFKLKDIRGVLVGKIFKGGPADNAGIKQGDIITSFDDKPIQSANELIVAVGDTPVDKKANITIIRNNKIRLLTIVVGKRETAETFSASSDTSNTETWRGITVENISSSLQAKYQLPDAVGVVVISVDSRAKATSSGIKEGDVIDEIARQSIENIEQFKKITSESQGEVLIHTLNLGYIVIREE
ncbi:Do family serine endopeptidase [bacterium]|nr:Do family serine endopeptidase [bacterium]MCP5462940.1 Do family serine endopeptidase [bacterium]